MNRRHMILGLLAAPLVVAGCSNKNKTKPEAAGPGGASISGGDGTGSLDGQQFGSQQELLAQRTVYFELDSASLDPQSQAVIEAHARHLAANGSIRVVLEGHADERGSREYNLALGERRARSVSRLMNSLGVDSGRISETSYGEERPAAVGHDESSWRLNRRVEILYGNY
ncbi:MAG: peptidoglycan-associated lipoprotein Pal [Gammaproteobacteria bacterium]|nr:peptidoglycan-associated lipoprotein Pal [Gammaproteobacteria bacterium]